MGPQKGGEKRQGEREKMGGKRKEKLNEKEKRSKEREKKGGRFR